MHESQLTVLTLYFIVTENTRNQNTAETHQTDDETASEWLLFTIWSCSTHKTHKIPSILLNITMMFYWRCLDWPQNFDSAHVHTLFVFSPCDSGCLSLVKHSKYPVPCYIFPSPHVLNGERPGFSQPQQPSSESQRIIGVNMSKTMWVFGI